MISCIPITKAKVTKLTCSIDFLVGFCACVSNYADEETNRVMKCINCTSNAAQNQLSIHKFQHLIENTTKIVEHIPKVIEDLKIIGTGVTNLQLVARPWLTEYQPQVRYCVWAVN